MNKRIIVGLAIIIAMIIGLFAIAQYIDADAKSEISGARQVTVKTSDLSYVTWNVYFQTTTGEKLKVKRSITKYGYFRAKAAFSEGSTIYITDTHVIGKTYLGFYTKFKILKGERDVL